MTNNIPAVWKYSDIPSYMKEVGKALSPKRAMSYAQWAKRLGYSSRRSVGMMISGRYPVTESLAHRLGEYLKLSFEEKNYLVGLARVRHPRVSTEVEKKKLEGDLERLRLEPIPRLVLAEDRFSFVAHWYHYAIKQLIACETFKPDPVWIAKRLGNRLTPQQVVKSLERMLRLGVIEKTDDSKGYRNSQSVSSLEEVPAESGRMHHKEQLQKAVRAVDSQQVSEREFCSLTLAFDPDSMQEAKTMIREFVDRFDSRFSGRRSREVYQLNVQFFSHTEKE